MKRRAFLKQGLTISSGLVLAQSTRAAAEAAPTRWRTFEVITKVEIQNPSGITRAWLPLPLMVDSDYYRHRRNHWVGNAVIMRAFRLDRYGTGLLYLEWPASEKAPVAELTCQFMTRDRLVDLDKRPTRHSRERVAVLKHFLEPTRLIPTDGIVGETSRGITRGLDCDIDRARAIYEWVVENTFRDPKIRGCGLGDIRAMLETRYLGGKCADLNALYVGLARSAGLPARDLYGVRCGASAEFNCLGKDGDITKAQHCRAEVYLENYGWVPVDPADVRKVVLEERPGLTLQDPIAQRAKVKLFGAWEMNYLPLNYANDVKLPNSDGDAIPFLMYPQAETAVGWRDSLEPSMFRYRLTARETSRSRHSIGELS